MMYRCNFHASLNHYPIRLRVLFNPLYIHIFMFLLLFSSIEGKIRVEDIVRLGSRGEDADIGQTGKV